MTDKKHATEEKLTRYEKARILGARALQIAMGSPFMVKLSEEDLIRLKYNPVEIAKLEYSRDLVQIGVKRTLPQPQHKEEAPKKE